MPNQYVDHAIGQNDVEDARALIENEINSRIEISNFQVIPNEEILRLFQHFPRLLAMNIDIDGIENKFPPATLPIRQALAIPEVNMRSVLTLAEGPQESTGYEIR